MSAPAPVVAAAGLRRRYPGRGAPVDALGGVDLVVAPGEAVAVVGESGSGKSTLLHILGCLDRPTGGSYRLEGADVSRLGDAALAQVRAARIGFVFQTFELLAHKTVLENVALPFLYRGVGAAEARRRAARALERVGIAGRARHRPRELSGGEMQRAAIARAIAGEPALLLADEPTGNLDSATGRAVLAVFDELHRAGATLVIVTHNPDVAAACGRTVRLRDGRLLPAGGA